MNTPEAEGARPITPDEAEAKSRAAWLNKHGAPADWVAMKIGEMRYLCDQFAQQESDLTALRAERDGLRADIERLERDRCVGDDDEKRTLRTQLAEGLATKDVLLAEYSRLAKERQEWALHTSAVICELNTKLAEAEKRSLPNK